MAISRPHRPDHVDVPAAQRWTTRCSRRSPCCASGSPSHRSCSVSTSSSTGSSTGRMYLAPEINDLIPGNAHQAMLAVGVVEIVAGLVVAVRPRFGGYLVAAWLGGIIVNLLLQADHYDIALRDFGLLIAALALARLATAYDRTPAEA